MAAAALESPSPWLRLYVATCNVADFSPEDVLAVFKAPTSPGSCQAFCEKAHLKRFILVFGPLVWRTNGVIIWVAFIWNCKTNLTKPTCPFCTARYPLYYAASCHIVLCKACSAWGYKVVMGSSERAHALAFLGGARFKCPFLELN